MVRVPTATQKPPSNLTRTASAPPLMQPIYHTCPGTRVYALTASEAITHDKIAGQPYEATGQKIDLVVVPDVAAREAPVHADMDEAEPRIPCKNKKGSPALSSSHLYILCYARLCKAAVSKTVRL
jgi:hypothetical protein